MMKTFRLPSNPLLENSDFKYRILYLGWLIFYDIEVFHGPHQNNWYLLDRVFISFISVVVSLIGLVVIIDPAHLSQPVGIVLSFVLGFIATMIFWKEDSSKDKVATGQNDEEKMLVKN